MLRPYDVTILEAESAVFSLWIDVTYNESWI